MLSGVGKCDLYNILENNKLETISLGSYGIDEIKSNYLTKYSITIKTFLDDIFGDGKKKNGFIPLPNRHTALMYFSIMQYFFSPYLDKWETDNAINNTTVRGNIAGFINGKNDTHIFLHLEKEFLNNSEKMINVVEDRINNCISHKAFLIEKSDVPFIIKDEKALREYLIYICRYFVEYLTILKDESLLSAINFDESRFLSKSTARLFAECMVFISVSMRYNEDDHSTNHNSRITPEKIIKVWMPYSDVPIDNLFDLQLGVGTLFETAKMKLAQKKYDESFKLFSAILFSKDQDARDYKNESLAKQAWLIQTQKAKTDDYDIQSALLNASENDPNYEMVAYALSQTFQKSDNEKSNYMKWLKKATTLQSVPAAIELVKNWESADSVNIQSKRISGKAIDDFLMEIIKKPNVLYSESREIYFLIGQYYDLCAEKEASQHYYQLAADLGHDLAHQKLDAKKRQIRLKHKRCFKLSAPNVCVINGYAKTNKYFADSLPTNDLWHLISVQPSPSDFCSTVNDIEDLFASDKGLDLFNNQIVNIENIPSGKLIFAFLSDNQNKNIEDSLELLDWLYNAVVSEPRCRQEIIEKVDIYVNAQYECASTLLDASISDMGNNIYFRTHIVSRAKNSIDDLLLTVPLFTTMIRRKQAEDKTIYDNNVQVVVLGNSELTENAVTDILSCGYISENVGLKLNIISPEAEMEKRRFFRRCPGYSKASIKNVIVPNFINISDYEEISEEKFTTVSNNNNKSSLSSVLSSADYFIIDIGQDFDNIEMAKRIREYAIKRDDSFNHIPMIAAYCKDDNTAFCASKLTVGNKNPGATYYNNYNIICFGMNDSTFSFESLCNNRIEKQALYIHSVYYGKDGFAAQNSYYSFRYNQDSSQATAISLPYRLFAQNLFFPKWQQYASDKSDAWSELTDNLDKIDIESAAENEHYRWINYMLSHGWSCATPEQIESFVAQATGNDHKHLLAKLHPFITNWDNLQGDKPGNLIDNLAKRFPDFKNPVKSTMDNIKHTKEFVCSILG